MSTLCSAGERNNISHNAIEVKELSKKFPGHQALDKVNFNVARGSIHGFLGPNGAGKTTAIKIMLGLIPATAGTVTLLGEPLSFGRSHQYLHRLNYLPQDPVFPEGLTGKEALSLVGDIYKIEKRLSARRVERLLEYFQLTEAANRRIGVYSRGMQQRLGIAAAMLTEPELLILDEPVSALDPEGRRRVLQMINKLRGKATVFFSSHILADVERVCDHVTIIDRGYKLLDAGTTSLLTRYAMEQYLISVSESQMEKAASLIKSNHAVRQVTNQDGKLLVVSQPGRSVAMAEELLPMLIEQGIKVTEFMQNRTNLEEVFFKVLGSYKRTGGDLKS